MAATRSKHADDTVRVIVLRDDREVTLLVVLASAK
jgi:hypothetical protein